MNEISTKTTKKVSYLSKGSITYLIQIGKSDIIPFSDYEEVDENIYANNLMLAVKVVEAKNLIIADENSSDPYCVLKINGIEKKTRVIDCTLNPIWNQTFYFDISSYSTNELSIKIFDKDKLSKDDLLFQLTIPINKFQCGIVEDKWYSSIHLITHLVYPGHSSFEPYPFTPLSKIINIQNLSFKPDVFCLVQLKGDEYWRYTKIGNFSDYYKFEYIDNSIINVKASNLKKTSEEINIDISQSKDTIFENSFGKFKLSFVNEIKPFTIAPYWKCNILIKEILNITKKKDILWIAEINNNSLGYTYDGKINKYLSININSIQTDEIKFIFYKNKKGKQKEYGKCYLKIFDLQMGMIEEKEIPIVKNTLLGSKITKKKILLSLHLTPPNAEPFINQIFNPLIMHIYVIEAINVPKTDITSKSDPYVLFKFESDKIGIKTKALDNTLTPQWNELIDLIITNPKENLTIDIWDKNIKKDKLISSTNIDIQKYFNYEPHFEWIKINKILLNLVIHVKPKGESFITKEQVNLYQLSPIPVIK